MCSFVLLSEKCDKEICFCPENSVKLCALRIEPVKMI